MTKRINSVRDLNVYNLDEKYEHIFAKLVTMERKADSFCTVR